MDWQSSVFEVIDLRAFSNIWYWVGLAVLWSTVSHWVIGVPFDLVLRARRRKPPEAMNDLHDITRVNVNRILYIAEVSGSWIALIVSSLLTVLVLIAVLYDVEFAQAVLLLLAPMPILFLLAIRTAKKIRAQAVQGDALVKILTRHRFFTQLLGVVAIFAAAMFGMYKNLHIGPFGGF